MQGFRSLQLSGTPGAQRPPWQSSRPLQRLPSEHEVPLTTATFSQPVAGLHVTIAVEPRPAHRALRWTVRLENRGPVPLGGLEIMPLRLRFALDVDRDRPRVRHLSGSYHYDGVYPPRAFRLHEERFMTHDHCKPVRLESSTLGTAGEHVPVLQFAVGTPGRSLSGLYVGFEWNARWHLQAGWGILLAG